MSKSRSFTVPFKLAANLVVLGAVVCTGAIPPLLMFLLCQPVLREWAGWLWITAAASMIVAVVLGVVFLPLLQLSGLLRNRILKRRTDEDLGKLPFVGFAWSEFRGRPRIDTDDDVGFLRINSDAVEFEGELGTRRLAFDSIRKVRPARIPWYASAGVVGAFRIDYDDAGIFRSVIVTSRQGKIVFETNRHTKELEEEIKAKLANSS